MYAPPGIEIGLNMNAIEKKWFKWGQQVHSTIYLPPLLLCIFFMPESKLLNFNSDGY